MTKIIGLSVLSFISPIFAFAAVGPVDCIPYPEWIIFLLAMVFTASLSAQAFDRPPVTIADAPTYPKYMTRRSLYNFGKGLFVFISLIIYAVMVRYHTDLPQIIRYINADWYEPLNKIIENKEPSYLLVIFFVSACFLLLIRTEGDWNFYLSFRDLIHSWVSIPCLTKTIVCQINDALHVPAAAQDNLPSSRPDWLVHSTDFLKNPESMDRAWAEVAYLQSWISAQHTNGPATTFFSEKSFAWDEINNQFANLFALVGPRKQGYLTTEAQSFQLMKDIATHRNKLARLIACYIVFMNSSRASLLAVSDNLGIAIGQEASENPLRYSAIYIVSLAMAVYCGVYVAAFTYDVIQGAPIGSAIMNQDPSIVWRWIFLSFGDYGIPVLAILALRNILWNVNPVRKYPIMVAYAWIFLLAALLSTVGLSVVSEFVGKYAGQWGQFLYVCQQEVPWSLGPAMICIYINHYLDRQIDPMQPNIERLHIMSRVSHALLFTLIILVITVPLLSSIQASPQSPWEASKLRFVVMVTIFFVTTTLTLVAQFALIKPKTKSRDTLSDEPRASGQQIATA